MSGVASPGALVSVDVGGNKTAVLVVAGEGQVQSRVILPTEVTSPAHTLAGIAQATRQALVSAHLQLRDVVAVGLGIPGRVDRQTGMVRLAVNLKWREMPVGALLSETLGVSCFLENDVRTAALGVLRDSRLNGVRLNPCV